MNVKEMVEKWLTDNGYDGLYNNDFDADDPCGCGLDDLICCDFPSVECCVPAYKREVDGEIYYFPTKLKEDDKDVRQN
ncbi:MAG: hypothetical protein LBQ52_04880 [Helicobacteraceae bacterium]|jgi:hypothetical protein|nr:hypothetical protein [Helicobacteraceae bacterium]